MNPDPLAIIAKQADTIDRLQRQVEELQRQLARPVHYPSYPLHPTWPQFVPLPEYTPYKVWYTTTTAGGEAQ